MTNDTLAPRHKLKLGGKLGMGSFATVYQGEYDGRKCAIKLLHAAHHGTLAETMFLREARLLLNLRHGNIVRCSAVLNMGSGGAKGGGAKDTKASAQSWAMVLELMKGKSLYRKVCAQMTAPNTKVYSDAQALEWALDLARALEHLHLSAVPFVVHRDVKLANVLLTQEGGRLMAKLSDFGLHVVGDDKRRRLLRVRSNSRRSLQAHGQVFFEAPPPPTPPTPPLPSVSDANSPPGSSGDGVASDGAASCPAAYARPAHHSLAGFALSHPQVPTPPQPLNEAAVVASGAASGVIGRGGRFEAEDGAGVAFGARRSFEGDAGAPPRTPSRGRGVSGSGYDPLASGASAASSTQPAPSAAPGDWDDDAVSVCTDDSMVMGQPSFCTDASVCWESDDNSDGEMDVEAVFDFTSQTGSALYMSPETHLGQPYNEKTDVFSFGVVLYELTARTCIAFTELPSHSTNQEEPDKYVDKVAAGYRPARPKKMSNDVWGLISRCWQQDPVQRPHMSQVVGILQHLLDGQAGMPRYPSAPLPPRPKPSADSATADAPPPNHSTPLRSIAGGAPAAPAPSQQRAQQQRQPQAAAAAATLGGGGGCCVIC